jgi:hypothetical protein
MSYARNNHESDVYVIESGEQFWCYGSGDQTTYHADTPIAYNTRSQLVIHLAMHRAYGDLVPESAFERLDHEYRNLGEYPEYEDEYDDEDDDDE